MNKLTQETRHGANHFFAAFLVCAILASALYVVQTKGRSPYVYLRSDAGNVASIVLARQNPELFVNDGLLSDAENVAFYKTLHTHVFLPFLEKLYGNFGDAYHALLGPHAFLYMFGCYCLGYLLFRNWLWAFAFVLVNFNRAWIGLGTYWGFGTDAFPRTTFQALLPYLICLALIFRSRYKFWPLIMALAGLMVYAHPVSTPAWAFALWLGFIPFLPKEWEGAKKIGYMLFLGFICVLTVSPFAYNYLSSHAHEVVNFDHTLVKSIMADRYAPGFLDINLAIDIFFSQRIVAFIIFTAIAAVFFLRSQEQRDETLSLLLAWTAGIFFISVLVPYVDYTLADINERLPYQIDLIRGIKFFVFLGIIFIFTACHRLTEEVGWENSQLIIFPLITAYFLCDETQLPKSYYMLALTTLFVLSYFQGERLYRWGKAVLFHPVFLTTLVLISCVALYTLHKNSRYSPQDLAKVEALEFLKDLETKDAMLSLRLDPLAIRYYSQKAVAFAYKDGGSFGYSNPAKLIDWHQKKLRVRPYQREQQPYSEREIKELYQITRDFNARYLILNTKLIPTKKYPHTVFQNNYHTILDTAVNRGTSDI